MEFDPAKNTEMRRQFEKLSVAGTAPFEGAPARLRNILMVGAMTDESGNLSDNDRSWLRSGLMILKKAEIPVSPRFNVSIANLNPEYGGEDFLTGKFAADLVIICSVYNPPEGMGSNVPHHGFYARSPLHSQESIWHDRVMASGAKALYVVGSTVTEINAEHFRQEGSKLRLISQTQGNLSLFVHEDYLAQLTAAKARGLKNQGGSIRNTSLH